jgi:Fe2+ or Zn2+ uptake regulation protein
MTGYLQIWINYRKNLLELIIKNPRGIREAELLKLANMSRGNFFRVIRLLEERGLIYRKVFGSNAIYITPTDNFILICRYNMAEIEFTLMDIDELGLSIIRDMPKILKRCLDG